LPLATGCGTPEVFRSDSVGKFGCSDRGTWLPLLVECLPDSKDYCFPTRSFFKLLICPLTSIEKLGSFNLVFIFDKLIDLATSDTNNLFLINKRSTTDSTIQTPHKIIQILIDTKKLIIVNKYANL
jgi:hypothetical protein